MTYPWEIPQCKVCRLFACCEGLDHCRTVKYDAEGKPDGYEPGCTAYRPRRDRQTAVEGGGMRVLLVDIDSKIPNLALMKVAAYHRARGLCFRRVQKEQA